MYLKNFVHVFVACNLHLISGFDFLILVQLPAIPLCSLGKAKQVFFFLQFLFVFWVFA
jgi:hypothetical protein